MASTTFDYTGALQTFTVPAGITSITITAIGASGGAYGTNTNGGRGASLTGTFTVIPGEELAVLVGGTGGYGPSPIFGAGGGGGGSFVWRGTKYTDVSMSTLLVAAGGGGGALGSFQPGLNATTDRKGVDGDNGGGSGGSEGSGGGGGNASGGAGISGDGALGGTSIYGGGTGGPGLRRYSPDSSGGGAGGFGGGGGGNIYPTMELLASSGGGGGYSGGGGGGFNDKGGGGGSFNVGTNQVNIISTRSGNGIVSIDYIDPPQRGIPLF